MCFNVFQPVCDEETGEMFANLCEAKCRGPEIRTVPCREESLQAVEAFAATQSSMTQQEIDTMVAEHNAKQETDVTEEEREANSAVNSANSRVHLVVAHKAFPDLIFPHEAAGRCVRSPRIATATLGMLHCENDCFLYKTMKIDAS